MGLTNFKNQIFLSPDNIVMVVDIEQVDEKTKNNATNLCGKDDAGKAKEPKCLVKLKDCDRYILLPTNITTVMKKVGTLPDE